MFIVATLVCAVLLTISYMKLATQEFGRVLLRKLELVGVVRCRKTMGEEMDENAARKEAMSYSMFIVNLIYEASVFLLAFVMLPRINMNIPTYAVYALVAGLSGVAAFGFSYGLI